MQKILEGKAEPRSETVVQDVHVHKLAQRLDEETLSAIAADYAAGMTSTELRQTYQLGKGSVLRLLAESGVEMRRRSLEPEQLNQVVERYQAGLAIREVAAELGLPKTTVQDALRNAEVKMRPAARRPKPR